MNAAGENPQAHPDHNQGTDELKPTAEAPRRWYQARPGSRGSVNILGKDYPWWIAVLIVLLIIA